MEQHEEDLEQTMMMKKQMEKKIIEATEEVEESKGAQEATRGANGSLNSKV